LALAECGESGCPGCWPQNWSQDEENDQHFGLGTDALGKQIIRRQIGSQKNAPAETGAKNGYE